MKKIVLIGAGSLQFGTGMLGDIFQSDILQDAKIVLNDINENAVNHTLKIAQDYITDNGLSHKITVETDLKKALKDTDFVVISIEVGDRFSLWDMDWKIPQQYGIKQIFGENGGAGGLFHSLRIIPPILEICDRISEISPDATVFNFSNPMSRICTTVHRKYPGLKFIGMCHEIASLERHLPPMLGKDRNEIRFRAAGLNHFSVMIEVMDIASGKCLYDDVRKCAKEYFRQIPGYSEIYRASRKSGKAIETEGWMNVDLSCINDVRPWSDRRLFREILQRFNLLPITTDSHFGEYIGWAHDVSDYRGIADFYAYYRNYLGKSTPGIASELHERVVPIMEGLITDSGYEEAAINIPNKGYIADLPDRIVVEVPAIVNKEGIRGISMDVPPGVRGLLCNQVGIHNMTAEAVLNQSRDLVIQALLVDPVTTVAKGIPELVDHMIAEQAPWLNYLK